jgi:hypothetical protein
MVNAGTRPSWIDVPVRNWYEFTEFLSKRTRLLKKSQNSTTSLAELELLCWMVLDLLNRLFSTDAIQEQLVIGLKRYFRYCDDEPIVNRERSDAQYKLPFTERLVTQEIHGTRDGLMRRMGIAVLQPEK